MIWPYRSFVSAVIPLHLLPCDYLLLPNRFSLVQSLGGENVPSGIFGSKINPSQVPLAIVRDNLKFLSISNAACWKFFMGQLLCEVEAILNGVGKLSAVRTLLQSCGS